MSKSDILVYIIMTIITTSLVLNMPNIWVTNIILETQDILTILNGLTATMSIMIGFTATTIAIMSSKPDFTDRQRRLRILIIVAMLWPQFFTLTQTYLELLLHSAYELALRLAMTGLIISVITLFYSLDLFTR